MIASLLFFLLGWVVGFVTLRRSKFQLDFEELIIWSLPLGVMLLTFWTFILTYGIRQQDIALIISCSTASIYCLEYLNRGKNLRAIAREAKERWHTLNPQDFWAWTIVLLPWLIYSLITIPYLLFFREGNLIAGWINVWGDWAVHLRNSTYFAARDAISLDNPLYAGTEWRYPYLSSFLSAILQRLNLPLDRSLTWPTMLLFTTLPGLLYSVGRKLTNSRRAGVFFTYFVLLSGGMGIYFLVKDLLAGHFFWDASAYSPQLYTDMREAGQSVNSGIWFMNFIMSEFFPQRAFLAGIPLALFILMTIWQSVQGKTVHRKTLLFAGLLFGILPLIHTHSFVALGLIVPTLFGITALPLLARSKAKHKRSLREHLIDAAWVLLPAVGIGSIFLFLFVFDPSATNSFIHPIKWWVPRQEDPVNPLLWWLRNTGQLFILGSIGGLLHRRYLGLMLAGLVIFVIGNFVSFQPWQYDNLKLLTYWYILWAIPIAVLFAKLPRLALPLVIIGTLLMTGAGLADALSVTVSARTGGIQLTSADDIQFAKQVKAATYQEPNALFIAATDHDHAMTTVSGRRMYMGYEGWLWTYGFEWSGRQKELEAMYQLSPQGEQLIKSKGIDYITLGPKEVSKYKAATEALTTRFPTVLEFGQYKLLKVE